jgi:hypothetical protein
VRIAPAEAVERLGGRDLAVQALSLLASLAGIALFFATRRRS